MKSVLIVLGILLIQLSALANSCGSFLTLRSDVTRPLDSTEKLLGYLNLLLQEQIIGEGDVSRLITGLENGRVDNPISLQRVQTDSNALVHQAEIERYFQGSLSKTKLLPQLRDLQERLRSQSVVRAEAQDKTKSAFAPIKFVPVKTDRGFGQGKSRVEKHSIEIMTTPVTQYQWAQVMGENPAQTVDGPHSISLPISGKLIQMQPDNPVESVNWWSVAHFANQLSIRAGLKPVYDFSNVVFWPGTSPETGDATVSAGRVRINAPNGNLYLAEGYRLPSRREFEHIFKMSGISPPETHVLGIRMRSWFEAPETEGTQPVAQLQPFKIGSQEIYDLFGNVSEWLNDSVGAAYGGNFRSSEFYRSLNRDSASKQVGFRLVRTLRNEPMTHLEQEVRTSLEPQE